MTTALSSDKLVSQLNARFAGSVVSAKGMVVEIKAEFLLKVAEYLKTTPEFVFDYLSNITAVDYQDYFELVYQLVSLEHNHGLVLKTRCYNRTEPVLPSVVGIWRGADFQEREIYDLFGIKFDGHPNLKRIFLWEGYKGYPLRKDYLEWQS